MKKILILFFFLLLYSILFPPTKIQAEACSAYVWQTGVDNGVCAAYKMQIANSDSSCDQTTKPSSTTTNGKAINPYCCCNPSAPTNIQTGTCAAYVWQTGIDNGVCAAYKMQIASSDSSCDQTTKPSSTTTNGKAINPYCCCNKYVTPTTPTAPTKPLFIMPDIQIPIPGLTLTPSSSIQTTKNPDGTYSFSIPWISQYILGLYNYGLGVAGIIAAIMLMAGGLLWLISAGDASKVTQAKEFIVGSVTGLIILFSSYIILYQINPSLTVFPPITLGYIARQNFSDENFPSTGSTQESSPSYCGCVDWKSLYATSNLKTAESIKIKLSGTPLADYSDSIAKLSQQYNIDPALVLAIWKQDSSYATQGAGATNKNPGNVTCGSQSNGTGWSCNGRFRQYNDFNAAITDWFNVVGKGSRLNSSPTIRDLIKTYAPPSENNTQGYINAVMNNIDSAHNGTLKTADGNSAALQKCSDINSGC